MSLSSGKISHIIQHEYLSRFKTKAFLISSILAPLGLVVFIGVIAAMTLMNMETERKIALVDKSNDIGAKVVKANKDLFFLSQANVEDLRKQVLNNDLDGYVLIPEDVIEKGRIEVFSKGGGGLGFVSGIKSAVNDVVKAERMRIAGIDENKLDYIQEDVSVSTQKITEKGEERDDTEFLTIIGYFLGFAIYLLVFIYGSIVMRGVIEEKANRVIEVLASSAKPFEIMFGKVIGIGLLGLTQVLFWVIAGAILLFAAQPFISSILPDTQNAMSSMQATAQQLPADFKIPYIHPMLIVGFFFYFIAGYFIYATLFAAVGSAVDQESDSQTLTLPISLPIVLTIMMIPQIMNNPDSGFSVAVSLIPIFTPIIMMVRIAATNVPIWQISLSVILLIGTFIGALWVASKIYRIGILMTGKKPTFKDLVKWINA
jgi:ABC-2 type transport system permease protein